MDKRCIKCELIKDYDKDFQWEAFSGLFCKDCWKKNSNDLLKAYQDSLSWELFYLRYPTPWDFAGRMEIEKKYKETSKKDLLKKAKEKIEADVKELEEFKKQYEDRGNTSDEQYKYYVNSLNHAKSQKAIIVNLEPRYKN